jgi:hypothetical protein
MGGKEWDGRKGMGWEDMNGISDITRYTRKG